MSRDTTTVTTPIKGLVITLNTYITGREFEYIQEPLMKAMEIKPNAAGVAQLGAVDITKVNESTHRLIEKMVVSVGDVKTDLVDAVLDLPQLDYQFVIDEINKLTKKNS